MLSYFCWYPCVGDDVTDALKLVTQVWLFFSNPGIWSVIESTGELTKDIGYRQGLVKDKVATKSQCHFSPVLPPALLLRFCT